MLSQMAGAEDDIRDALTKYTTAVSGAHYARPLGRGTAEVCLYRRRMNQSLVGVLAPCLIRS